MVTVPAKALGALVSIRVKTAHLSPCFSLAFMVLSPGGWSIAFGI